MFSDKIKNFRSEMGLTQIAFGERYNIPRRTIQGWEKGAALPEWEQEFILFRLEHDLNNTKGDD